MEEIIAYLGTMFIGWFAGWIKGKIAQSKIVTEVITAGEVLKQSATDGKLTREEVKKILSAGKGIKKAYKEHKK